MFFNVLVSCGCFIIFLFLIVLLFFLKKGDDLLIFLLYFFIFIFNLELILKLFFVKGII